MAEKPSIQIVGARQHNLKNLERRDSAQPAGLSSPGSAAAASPRWPSTRSTPRASAATSKASRPTLASSSSSWKNPTSISSRACPRRSPSSSAAPAPIRARPSRRPPRSTTTCASCSPPSASPHDPHDRRRADPRHPRRHHRAPCSSCPEGSPRRPCSHRSRPVPGESPFELFDRLRQQGFVRVRLDGVIHELDAHR